MAPGTAAPLQRRASIANHARDFRAEGTGHALPAETDSDRPVWMARGAATTVVVRQRIESAEGREA